MDRTDRYDRLRGGRSRRIDRELREAGEPIGALDSAIAGIVRDAGGTVVTADAHFERVEGLDVVRYEEEY